MDDGAIEDSLSARSAGEGMHKARPRRQPAPALMEPPTAPPRAAGGKAAGPCPQEEEGGRPWPARNLRPGYCTHPLPWSCPGMSWDFNYYADFGGELRCSAR